MHLILIFADQQQNTKCSSIVEPGKYLLSCEPQIKTLLDCMYRGYQLSSK
jgi:hypothetical protein